MSIAWRPLFRAPCFTRHRDQARRIADLRPFEPGDAVLLRQKLDRTAPPILTRALKIGGRIDGHKGVIEHNNIIGKRVRDVVKTAQLRSGRDGTEYRLHKVKLEEYVRLSRRLVTPIYPADAALIVELLDLHVEPFDSAATDRNAPNLEILEAGTGHGALTLYLSRAIHGANPPRPRMDDEQDGEAFQKALSDWKRARRAIIHTIDCSAKFSAHAENVVKGFRRGMYYYNVDFHVTDVGAWTRKALDERDDHAFLSHAFLDMPDADAQLGIVAQALRTDGCLVVFNPSITQIMDCAARIKHESILLELDKVIELGNNGSSGGREWSMRPVKPRAAQKSAMRHPSADKADVSNGETTNEESEDEEPSANEEWSMVCRPKVGERIVGGGFLGVWRKQRNMKHSEA